MKAILTLVFGLVLLTGFAQEEDGYVWIPFPNSVKISSANADSVKTYSNSMESMINYFYASRIRKDKAWEKVLPKAEERSERLKRELVKYETWEFVNYHIISYTEFAPGKYWVKIYMKISFNGRVKGGIDEVDIEMIDGNWVITSVPT